MRARSFILIAVFSFHFCHGLAQTTAPTRPPILGMLNGGKYSNAVVGVELQLDPSCVFLHEERSVVFSTQMTERLSATLQCGDNTFLLSSSPLHTDEKLDLRSSAEPSLQGVIDAGGYQARGSWQKKKVDGTLMLVQELTLPGKEAAFYHAMLIGRRYFSILATGPESAKAELAQTASKIRILSTPSK